MEAAIIDLEAIERTKARMLDLLASDVPERDIVALPGLPEQATITGWHNDPGFNRVFGLWGNKGYHELAFGLVEDVDQATLTLGANAGRERFEQRKRELAVAHPEVFEG